MVASDRVVGNHSRHGAIVPSGGPETQIVRRGRSLHVSIVGFIVVGDGAIAQFLWSDESNEGFRGLGAAGAGLDGAIGAAVAVGLKSAPFSPDPLSVLRSSFRFAL